MILISTTETVPYQAPWRADDPKAPVYHLRAATVAERLLMESELTSTYRAGRVLPSELMSAARSGIEKLLAGAPELDQILDLINRESEDGVAGFTDEEKRLSEQVRGILLEHWPPYQDLEARVARRREMAPYVAFRRFCVSIVGEGVTFKKDQFGFVSEETMAALDPFELLFVGSRVYEFAYGVDPSGNLKLPSSSAEGQQTSQDPGTSKAGGKSATGSGSKTRAPRPRRGRSRS